MNETPHLSVLYKEIIHALQPRNGGRYVDGTLGAGGHARGILEACAPDGRLLGLDVDPQALAIARKTLAPYEHRTHLVQASYTSLSDELVKLGWDAVEGIVLDLGASSMQFDTPERGFSFLQDAPLDMRFGPHVEQTAADLVNESSERELADLIYRYGEERDSRKIARAIVKARPLHTTRELASVIESVSPRRGDRLHPATRTFQAVRMAVNDEPGALRRGLEAGPRLLARGGRLGVISFHSGEDRIVKQTFRTLGSAGFAELEPSPLTPGDDEVRANARARSAKLRVLERLP